MSAINDRRETFRRFAMQTAILAWAALILFWAFYAADHYFASETGGPAFSGPFTRYFSFDPDSDAVATLAGINVAVFGIVITIVSIIVQLTADRYTGVARMFLRDRVNIRVAAYYVITCGAAIWLAAAIQDEWMPRLTQVLLICLTTGGIMIMMPYFGYVFWFLEPQNLIKHIRHDAIESVTGGAIKADQAHCFEAQAQMLFSLEELTDITNNSISGKDKIIASSAVDALKDFAVEYLKVKPQASEAWFTIGPEIKSNPDFVAMDEESLSDLVARRTWVEWKVMRQYLSIYNEALSEMRDINYVIAIDTRYIAEAAARANDTALIYLAFRFLNSYLRSTINAREVRTAYNVLNQYRKLVESLIEIGQPKAAGDGVKHMKYYGLVSFDMEMSFITETVAYDLAALAQHANEHKSEAEQSILSEFLELDRPPFVRGQEKALMGVRKAQVKLAAYYIMSGQEDRARAIAQDMRDEPPERMRIIQHQLQRVESKDFWEIIDRGSNFEYMPDEQKACLATFFSWLDVSVDAG